MFYTPKHCCECGEKIERNEWKLLTSRRFCEICESELKIHDWMPRIVLGIGVLFTVFGIGSLLKKSDKPLNVTTSLALATSNKNSSLQSSQALLNGGIQNSTQKQPANTVNAQSNALPTEVVSNLNSLQSKQKLPEKRQKSESEAVYFCGAQTKKGTACTRRVKGGGRCWQHEGQTAILSPEKLAASR